MKKKSQKFALNVRTRIGYLFLFFIVLGISIFIVLDLTILGNSDRPTIQIDERVTLANWCSHCRGDGSSMCSSTGTDYAKGRFVDCSLKTREPFPNSSIRGYISDMDYEIDRELFLKIAKEQEFPIVCEFKRRTYGSPWVNNEGDYCKNDITEINGDSWNPDYEAYCCFSNYCASWGDVYNLCTCDDSLDYDGELTEITCQSEEGKQECGC